MSPQQGIFIINLVIHIICTIPITSTNRIHHSSPPLLFTYGGENDISQKSISSYSTNNGKAMLILKTENVNMTGMWKMNNERKNAIENIFNSLLVFKQLTTHFSSHMYTRKKNLENFLTCAVIWDVFPVFFSSLLTLCSFIWQ